MTDVLPYLSKFAGRAADPGAQAAMKGFTRTLMFTFTDSKEDWVVRFEDGREAGIAKETHPKPDLRFVTTTDVLAGVMDRKINGVMAFLQRRIQAHGPKEDLLKLQKLLL
jgi:putative sterol carrier protein